MHNTGQGGGNRDIALGNTQHARLVRYIGNKHTLAADNTSDLVVDVISNSLGGRHSSIGSTAGRDSRNNALGQLDILSAVVDMQGKIIRAQVNNTLDLAALRQGRDYLDALGVLGRALKNLQSVSGKIQGIAILDCQLLVINISTILKIHISHNFSPFCYEKISCLSKLTHGNQNSCHTKPALAVTVGSTTKLLSPLA